MCDFVTATDEAAFQHVLEAGIKSAQGERLFSLRPYGGFVLTPGRGFLLSAAWLAHTYMGSIYLSIYVSLWPTKDTHIVPIIDGTGNKS